MPKLGLVDPKKVSDDIRRLTTKEFRDGLSEVVEFTSQTKEPVILTNHGKDRAALVSVDDLSVIELIKNVGVRDALVGCQSREAAMLYLVENYLDDLRDNRPDSTEALLLIVRYGRALAEQLIHRAFPVSLPSSWARQWSGTHLIAAALADARRLGLNDHDRASVVAALMTVAHGAVERIASYEPGAADRMHSLIETFETTAIAVGGDERVAVQFAKTFAQIVCSSNDEFAHTLLVWCIGEMAARGKTMVNLARRMAETLLAADPPNDARVVLHALCERDEFTTHPPLKKFRQTTALADEQLSFDERARTISRIISGHLAKESALQSFGAESLFSGIGEILAETANGSPTTILLAIDAARRVLKRAAGVLGKSPGSRRAFVEESCGYLVNCRRRDPSISVFVVTETLEAIRDSFPAIFAETMAQMIDANDPQLTLGITVCVTEGVEAELGELEDMRIEPPRFEVRFASSTRGACLFHPGNTASHFTPYWIALANHVSQNPRVGAVSPTWATDRLKVYRLNWTADLAPAA